MNIEILRYNPTRAPYAFAFVDLRIGPLTINGVNLRRDGTITGGTLLYVDRSGKKPQRIMRPAIEIPQDHEWMLAIRAAIERHTAGWTIEQMAPPALSEAEIEEKRKKRAAWELQEKIIADKKAAGKKPSRKAKPAARIPPAPQRIPPPAAAPPRARIEPGKPLIQRKLTK